MTAMWRVVWVVCAGLSVLPPAFAQAPAAPASASDANPTEDIVIGSRVYMVFHHLNYDVVESGVGSWLDARGF